MTLLVQGPSSLQPELHIFRKKEKENVIVPSYFRGMDGLLTEEDVYPLLEDDEFLVVEALEVELQHGGLAEGSRAARGQCTVFLKYSNHQQAQHSGTHTLLI